MCYTLIHVFGTVQFHIVIISSEVQILAILPLLFKKIYFTASLTILGFALYNLCISNNNAFKKKHLPPSYTECCHYDSALTPRSKFIFQFSGLFGNATEESYWAFSGRSQFVTAVNQMREEKL